MKAFIYVTKAKPFLFDGKDTPICHKVNLPRFETAKTENADKDESCLNGKIVACFDLSEAECVASYSSGLFFTSKTNQGELLEKSCLKYDELKSYLKNGRGYALHIENVEILRYPLYPTEVINHALTIPQSWNYQTYKGERCILISIKPQWVCKILNGEKTIEIRKTCPKGVTII